MKNPSRAVERLVVATGVASVAAQLTTIRECLAAFQGNEFVIALILFGWLAWGGLGTLTARTVTRGGRSARLSVLALLSIWLAGLALVQLAALRLLRDAVFIPGASVGFYPTLAYIGLIIAPYSFLVGFLLPYSLYVLRHDIQPDYPGARIYILDNLGDVTGAALFAFVLVYWATPFQSVALAGLPLVAVAAGLTGDKRRAPYGRWLTAGLVLVAMIMGVGLERETLKPLSGRLVHYEESRFGRIVVVRQAEQTTLFKDGVPVFDSQNVALAEETVHYPLIQLDRPRMSS
jgi:predicted membrane-bound spermidine synthase